MLPDETGGKYVAALSQVLAPLQHRLQIGDTQTQLYKVAVYERPTVAQVEAAYEFPAYLARVSYLSSGRFSTHLVSRPCVKRNVTLTGLSRLGH